MSKYKSIDLSQVINIDGWRVDETWLDGSRRKKTVYEQGTENLYVFKEPKERQQAQIWSELIASYIAGDLLGWPVQHSAIAIRHNKIGNLLEYIYDKKLYRFEHGEFFCKAIDRNYDVKEGERHTWKLINKIAKDFIPIEAWRIDYFQFWARTIAFDTLISNTDRHAQNWAVLLEPDNGKNIKWSMAPFYDNATSMGCEYDVKGLAKWFQNGKMNPDKLAKHLKKGCHHLHDEHGKHFHFEALCQRILKERSRTNDRQQIRAKFEAVAALDLSKLNPVLEEIMAMKDLPAEAMLSKQQAEVIMALLQAGQNRVKNSLEMIKK